jgi:hypothetical protein
MAPDELSMLSEGRELARKQLRALVDDLAAELTAQSLIASETALGTADDMALH